MKFPDRELRQCDTQESIRNIIQYILYHGPWYNIQVDFLSKLTYFRFVVDKNYLTYPVIYSL